jgi:hypothetical protein
METRRSWKTRLICRVVYSVLRGTCLTLAESSLGKVIGSGVGVYAPWKHYASSFRLELGGQVAIVCKIPATDRLYVWP